MPNANDQDTNPWKTITKQNFKNSPPTLTARMTVTTVEKVDNSDKKMLAISTLPKQDVTQQGSKLLRNVVQAEINSPNKQNHETEGESFEQP